MDSASFQGDVTEDRNPACQPKRTHAAYWMTGRGLDIFWTEHLRSSSKGLLELLIIEARITPRDNHDPPATGIEQE